MQIEEATNGGSEETGLGTWPATRHEGDAESAYDDWWTSPVAENHQRGDFVEDLGDQTLEGTAVREMGAKPRGRVLPTDTAQRGGCKLPADCRSVLLRTDGGPVDPGHGLKALDADETERAEATTAAGRRASRSPALTAK